MRSSPLATSAAFTLRDEKQDLATGLDNLSSTLSAFFSGKSWSSFKTKNKILGHGWIIELTHSDGTWHPHAHLFFFHAPDAAQRPQELSAALRERWVQKALAQGLTAALSGQHAEMIPQSNRRNAARYLAKDTPRFQSGKVDIRSAGDILRDAVNGDLEAVQLWVEFEQATKSRRRFSWTPKLADRLAGTP